MTAFSDSGSHWRDAGRDATQMQGLDEGEQEGNTLMTAETTDQKKLRKSII